MGSLFLVFVEVIYRLVSLYTIFSFFHLCCSFFQVVVCWNIERHLVEIFHHSVLHTILLLAVSVVARVLCITLLVLFLCVGGYFVFAMRWDYNTLLVLWVSLPTTVLKMSSIVGLHFRSANRAPLGYYSSFEEVSHPIVFCSLITSCISSSYSSLCRSVMMLSFSVPSSHAFICCSSTTRVTGWCVCTFPIHFRIDLNWVMFSSFGIRYYMPALLVEGRKRSGRQ